MTDVVTSRAIGGDGPARDVDAELDRRIEKRAKAASKAEAEEALWEASVRRHHDAIRRRNIALWYAHHMDQAERLRRTLEPLIAFHEERARQLLEGAQA